MKLTVIGTGNMGKALMKGFIDGNIFKPEEITVYDVIEAARNNAASTFGVNAASDAASSVKESKPQFEIGDTVRVSVNIREGERERIQMFEGTVIARRGSGVAETFTVRRLSYGVGVERVFPVNSPNVVKVEVVRHGKVRRSKLYYLRGRVGKAAKVKEQIK